MHHRMNEFLRFHALLMNMSAIPGARHATLAELANFDDDEGYIVGEGAMPPGSHAV